MASYHLSVKILSRSSGRSGVAAAAYRSRSEIKDVRQGLTFNYSNKKDLGHCEIMAPPGAPAWITDRAELWNRVEAFEMRKDAQIMREVEVALPTELNPAEQIELLRQFCRENFVSKGMVADLCVHQKGDNPHAHIMLTMRSIEPDGFGKKVREWNAKDLVLHWRNQWAEIQNFHLAKAGHDVQVDHRSHATRGIRLLPQTKLGVPRFLSDQSEQERIADHQRIARKNGKTIARDPEIALEVLSYHHAVFSEVDIKRFILSHSGDRQQYDQALSAILGSKELVKLGQDDNGKDYFTTKSMLRAERKMLRSSEKLAGHASHRVANRFAEQAIANRSMSTEQKAAFEYILNGGQAVALVGYAGTGKSYTLGAVREAYEAQGYQLRGMALSGIAAEGLQTESGIDSTTIHRTLIDWDNDRALPDKNTVLIVDEAGMVGTRQMQKIVETAKAHGAKVVLVGDANQLQPIEAGGSFRGICDRIGRCEMSDVRRQIPDWQKEATKLLSGSPEQVARAIDQYDQAGHVHAHDTIAEAKAQLLADWKADMDQAGSRLIIAYRNKDVAGLNMGARQILKEAGWLDAHEMRFDTVKGKVTMAAGDRLIFLKNDKAMRVKNGTLGTVERVEENALSVRLDTGHTVAFAPREYDQFFYGYAATIHKIQGVTVDRAYVLATKHMDKHGAYVALSRHRQNVGLYWSKDAEGFKDYGHLKYLLSRERPKSLIKDYSRPRGIQVDLNQIYTRRYFKVTISHDRVAMSYTRQISTDARLDHKQSMERINRAAKTLSTSFIKRYGITDPAGVLAKVEQIEPDQVRVERYKPQAAGMVRDYRAFKITMSSPALPKPQESYVVLEAGPDIQQRVAQEAKAFAFDTARKHHLNEAQAKAITIKVEQVQMEHLKEQQQSKGKTLE
ncbi:MAG: Ti-type conjugative transfer relaxase TraA [Desulfobacteraceae bacterium]|nr:Ti-type conjugative transfer relaxase TraA [Desulfobacteraceae bacterium]